MTSYDLSVTKDYVPGWTVVDAVRELFQNALDQETIHADNAMFFKYEPGLRTLRIGNKHSILAAKSLLLGATTKADNENVIGKFGEGYKIATLVLTRLDKPVTFYNYGARELWKPRFVKSRKYGAEILRFEVDRKFFWDMVPDNNLTIEICNITEEDYEEIVMSNLHLQTTFDQLITPRGTILLDEQQKGRVYVNGLFVAYHKPYHYGYDFKPKHIQLDRDRKLVSDFHLEWAASSMWSACDAPDKIASLVRAGAADVAYVTSVVEARSVPMQRAATVAYQTFTDHYGGTAVPVTTQEEADMVPKDFKAVIVTENLKKLIKTSDSYVEPVQEEEEQIYVHEKLEYWLDKHEHMLSLEAIKELNEIITLAGKQL